jgi:hypothetical protein
VNEPHAGTPRPPVSLPVLWFAFLGGPAGWTAHLLASFPLVPVACDMGTNALLNAITAVTALVCAAAAVTGWIALRRLPAGQPGTVGDPFGRARFMARAGIILGIFFTFVTLVEGLPPLLHDACLERI